MGRAVTSCAPSRHFTAPAAVPALLLVVLVLVLAGCGSDGADLPADRAADPAAGGSATTDGADSSGRRVTIDGQEALVWGEGRYGVVLAHGAAFDAASWSGQAPEIAATGATVVAVEDISPDGIAAAVAWLRTEGRTEVALVGGSAGADSILDLVSREPDLPDQLVLLSPNGTAEGLGEQPKLFVASEDEPGADNSTELADSAPGDDNEAVLLPGSAHAQNIFDTDQGEPALDLVLERIQRFGVDD